MKLKMYLRGLGIGIMVTALIMGIATKDGRPLTDAEIKAAAAKLGMVDSNALKLTDLPQENGSKGSQPAGSDEAPDGGTNSGSGEEPSGKEGNTGGEAENSDGEETPDSAENPSGGEETPDSAENPSGGEETPDSAENPSGGEETPDSVEDPLGEEENPGGNGNPSGEDENPGGTESVSGEGETVKIIVSRGTGSRSVCNQLAEAGLIEDAAAFDQYLIDSGYSKRISAGTFEIPKGASDEEIAKIISKSR